MFEAGAWIVFPALFAIISGGFGVMLWRLASRSIPGLVVVPAGFAALVVATQAVTAVSGLVDLLLPLAIVVTALGIAIAWRERNGWQRPDPLLILAVVVVFAAYSVPLLVAGNAAFPGWMRLDDGATWLAFADQLVEEGRTTSGLVPSTFERVLSVNWTWYPVGAFSPLGVLARLSGQDPAWALSFFLAAVAALTAPLVWHLLSSVAAARWVKAVGAVVAPQAALLVGFFLWNGVKELMAAVLILAMGCLVVPAARGTVASGTALAVVAAATLGVLGVAGAVLVGPLLVWWLILAWRHHRHPGRVLRQAGTLLGLLLVCAAPTLALTGETLATGRGFVTSDSDIGPLTGWVSPVAWSGVWPTGDISKLPTSLPVVAIVAGGVTLLAMAGIASAVSRRAWEVPALATTAVTVVALSSGSNAWLAVKALAISSPVVLCATFAGVAWLAGSHRRSWLAVGSAAVLTAGVLASNGIAWSHAPLAPRDQLAELEHIGNRFAGQGPALMLEYNPYGVRHFLRSLDADGANELRSRPVPLTTGRLLAKAEFADIDELAVAGIADYRTLVLRRSGQASRPSGEFDLMGSGRYYEVWQRRARPRGVIAHLPLGSHDDPAATPNCADVAQLAEVTPPGGSLLAAPRSPVTHVELSSLSLPEGWSTDPASPDSLRITTSGKVQTEIQIPAAGSYTFWLQGSSPGNVSVLIDGQQVGQATHRLNWPGNPINMGQAELGPGRHQVSLLVEKARLRPGNSRATTLGPLVVAQDDASGVPVVEVPPADYAQLCSQSLDWVEAAAQ